jgi:hypothetical protein
MRKYLIILIILGLAISVPATIIAVIAGLIIYLELTLLGKKIFK